MEKAADPGLRRGICVKNLLPGTELQGLARSGSKPRPRKPTGPGLRRGICVKILLPETELQGLPVSGEQTAPWKKRPAPGGGAEFV